LNILILLCVVCVFYVKLPEVYVKKIEKFPINTEIYSKEEDNIIVKWAQEDVETSYNLLNKRINK